MEAIVHSASLHGEDARLRRAKQSIALRTRLHEQRAHLAELRGQLAANGNGTAPSEGEASAEWPSPEAMRYEEAAAARAALASAQRERAALHTAASSTLDALRDDVTSLAASLHGASEAKQERADARDATAALATWLRLEERACQAQREFDLARTRYRESLGSSS